MSGHCEGCGRTGHCVCDELVIFDVDRSLRNYVSKSDLRKLVEELRRRAMADEDDARFASALMACVCEIEKLLDGGE